VPTSAGVHAGMSMSFNCQSHSTRECLIARARTCFWVTFNVILKYIIRLGIFLLCFPMVCGMKTIGREVDGASEDELYAVSRDPLSPNEVK